MARLDSLRFVRVNRSEHFHFNALELDFFINSEGGAAMPFGQANILSRLFVIPYVLIAEAIFLRTERLYIILENHIVGLLALRNEPECLVVTSLAIRREYRRLGIATCALRLAENIAVRLGKKELKLSVLKRNKPAQYLYIKMGFSLARTTMWSLILRKIVQERLGKS